MGLRLPTESRRVEMYLNEMCLPGRPKTQSMHNSNSNHNNMEIRIKCITAEEKSKEPSLSDKIEK